MKLNDYLQAKALTPARFAKRIGVTSVSVTRYLAGTRRPDWQILIRIAKATDGQVTADDFMADPPKSRGNGRRSHEAVAA